MPTADQGPVPAPVAVPAPVPPVAGPGAGPGTGPGKGESFTYEGNLLAVGAPRIDDQVRLPKAGGYSSTSVLTVPTVAGQLALRQTYTADASGQNGDFSVAPELRGAAGSVAFPAALTVTTLGRTATNEVHLLAEATLGPAEGAGCVPELRHLTVDLTYDKDLVGVTSEAVRLVATDAGAASTGCPQPSVPPSASPPAIAAPDDAAPPASDSKEAGASAAPSGTSSEPRE